MYQSSKSLDLEGERERELGCWLLLQFQGYVGDDLFWEREREIAAAAAADLFLVRFVGSSDGQ